MTERERVADAPSAFKHGLTSKWAMEALEAEIEALAPLLCGSSPRTGAVMAAARKLAAAILHLRQVRSMRLRVLGMAAPERREAVYSFPGIARSVPEDVSQFVAEELSATIRRIQEYEGKRKPRRQDVDDAAASLLDVMEEQKALLSRLDDYERRALSQRSKALREFDYIQIELERRRAAAPAEFSTQ